MKPPRITGLRAVRKSKGLTVLKCAELLEIHDTTLSRWEQGKKAPENADWIAARLGVKVEDLYGKEETPCQEADKARTAARK